MEVYGQGVSKALAGVGSATGFLRLLGVEKRMILPGANREA